MSNANPYGPESGPPQFAPAKSNTGMIVGIVLAAVFLGLIIPCGGIMVGLLLPAVQSAREAARRVQCSNNMRQIGLAMHNYHSAYSSFPPAYTEDAQGNRLHSWRTLLLPFMEQDALYSQIDLDKPWDDPVNSQFANLEIPVYVCPSTALAPAMTTYVAVVDPKGVMSGPIGTSIQQISDGTSNTIMLVETAPENAVNWMSPDDIDLVTYVAASSDRHAHMGGVNTVFADGSVQFVADNTDDVARETSITKDAAD